MRFQISINALIFLSLLLTGCEPTEQKYSKVLTRDRSMIRHLPQTHSTTNPTDCVNFAALIPAAKLARQLKQTKQWVQENYRINLYADTLDQQRHIIGHVPPGADCYIVAQQGNWFFVQSPVSNELGWLEKKFVVGFILKDPITKLPCGGT
jgi:hypothetical protein